jgi:hypothetical protein
MVSLKRLGERKAGSTNWNARDRTLEPLFAYPALIRKNEIKERRSEALNCGEPLGRRLTSIYYDGASRKTWESTPPLKPKYTTGPLFDEHVQVETRRPSLAKSAPATLSRNFGAKVSFRFGRLIN